MVATHWVRIPQDVKWSWCLGIAHPQSWHLLDWENTHNVLLSHWLSLVLLFSKAHNDLYAGDIEIHFSNPDLCPEV